MYMSSGMSGQANEKIIVSQTVVKTLFAGFHLFFKVPELESMSLHLPKCSEDLTTVILDGTRVSSRQRTSSQLAEQG